MAQTKKEVLISTALKLFSKYGYKNTGIDTILKQSGVAKMTLYNHFKSKEELIITVINRIDKTLQSLLEKKLKDKSHGAEDKILQIFDILKEWFESNDFHGCPFQRASCEYSDHKHPIHQAAYGHKQFLENFIYDLVKELNVKNPLPLVKQICLFFDGSISLSQISGKPEYADFAKKAVYNLIKSNKVA